MALLRLKSTAAGHEAVRGLAAGTAAAAAAAAAAATARGGASVALTAVFTATAVAVSVAPSATAAAKAATAAAKGRLADSVSDVCFWRGLSPVQCGSCWAAEPGGEARACFASRLTA